MKYFRFRKRWLVVVGLLLTGTVAAMLFFRPRPRYNVLLVTLVTLDTTRADHLGCYGRAEAHTLVLDALAQEGVLFESAYATVPLTLPSHASILTGLYPPENGMHVNGVGRLDPQLPNLAETLRSQGYNTSAFIASVVLHSRYGLDHGFQIYDDDLAGGEFHGHESHLMRKANAVVDSALTWLNLHHEDPFFCWVHLFDPHAPYESHPEIFQDRFRENPYDGDIAFADLHVGRMVRFLKDKGVYDNTLIIIVGDHGEGLGEHVEDEHGFMLYNSTLHVPMIVSCPKLCKAGQRVAQSVSQVDIFPTVLDCLQVDSPGPVSGVSFHRGLTGSPLQPRFCYSETRAVFDAFRWAPLGSVTSNNWKYVQTTREELYDLREDAGELNNLAESQPDQLEKMRQTYFDLQEQMAEHEATDAVLTDADRRKLESLGYVGGRTAPAPHDADELLPDVKDMMVHYNAEFAARKLIDDGKTDTRSSGCRK
jgi:arylsulfatase A-like enzyme